MDDIDEVTLRITSQFEDFEVFLEQAVLSSEMTVKTLKILSQVIQNDIQRESVLKVLQVVSTSPFLSSHLVSLIEELETEMENFGFGEDKITKTVEYINMLLSQIVLKLPSSSSKVYLLLVLIRSKSHIMEMLQRKNPSLAENLRQLADETSTKMKLCKEEEQSKNRDQGKAGRHRRDPNEDDEVPPEDFDKLPIFPSPQDMDWSERIFLRANKSEGAFRDTNHYLDVQFRLMREDYIRPLREGIKEFRRFKEGGENFKKNHNLRLYENVQIISMVCKDSLEHRLQFQMTTQLKRVRWQSSKRLIFGSLLCLTVDDFETIFFAVVTNRDNTDLEKGIIQVRFESGLEDILELHSSEVLTMAETTAYFEAYRHVLEGLKEMKNSLPMERYLVQVNPQMKPPAYLLTGTMGRMDLTALLRKSSSHNASSVSVINPRNWPPLGETELNESQLEAVQTALTKELAIIQGPPGTGKTYVGLKVTEVLLENRAVWTNTSAGPRPILVVCYTNHALDQFLAGILKFCPEGIVRVGSRCKDPELEEFNLKNIRRKCRQERKTSMSVRNSIRDCLRGLTAMKEKIDSVSAKLEATTKGVVSAPVLEKFMLPGQYQNLVSSSGSLSSQTNLHTVLLDWISRGVIKLESSSLAGEDSYEGMAQEATNLILQGKGTRDESTINPNQVLGLAPALRVQLYRFWLQRAISLMQMDLAEAARRGLPPSQETVKQQRMARTEILPDHILRQVIHPEIFARIMGRMEERHNRQTEFCVRAWLGVLEGASKSLTTHIIEGKEVVHEAQVMAADLADLPRKARIELYRFWQQKLLQLLEGSGSKNPEVKKLLVSAKKEIVSDVVLQQVVSPRHLGAIRTTMLHLHQRQTQYFIKSWLGIEEFCQNSIDLEALLDELEDEEAKGGDGTGGLEEGAELNVDEEAEVIQNARKLDIDDDDDLFNFGKKTPGLDVNSAMKELGIQTTASIRTAQGAADSEGFSLPARQQKKMKKQLQSLLKSAKPMTEEEASRVTNLWSQQLNEETRVRLYLFWLRRYQDALRMSVKDHADMYNRDAQQLKELRMGEDKDILKDATIIGMTTTGAARYLKVLQSVQCPIVIMEEAAEVLEAHVVTTLNAQCQHLILIGDHQQLRPSPTVYELCAKYKLDLSLFERLVNNKLPHATLTVQHRMRPEVSRLVRHVYPQLRDHESTLNRPHIRGLKQDVFLLHHEMEEARNDETSSKSNQHEADLCVRLCRYLLQQGYSTQKITILTAYSGQVFALKNILKTDSNFFSGVRVTAVDNYQGEENDIIILSLVRSNQDGSVGFLSTDNRVCVALSRAKCGFYAFGNFKLMVNASASKSSLWKNIVTTAKENEQLGDKLILRCENHRDQEIEIVTAKDFDKMPEGGCRKLCGTRLDKCGHVCELSCHGYDRNHEQYKCRKRCERLTCKDGHPCTKKCFEDCGKCMFKVEKKVPMCGHVVTMECCRDPHMWPCKEQCQGVLPCGHRCCGCCGNCRSKKAHDSECTEEVERVWPCGHLVKSPCKTLLGELPCKRPCDATLDCGHACKGSCGDCCSGRVHQTCKEKCGKPLPGCGHRCRLPCGTVCLPCVVKSCGTACTHSSCKRPCGDPCIACTEKCPWGKTCRHQMCDSLCSKPCQPCSEPCSRTIKCKPDQEEHHLCSGLCGEKCFCLPCQIENFVPLAIAGVITEEESLSKDAGTKLIKLPQCGHIFNVVALDVYVEKKCRTLPAEVALTCPLHTCNERILDIDCWRYSYLMQERRNRFEKEKEILKFETTITGARRQRLLDSLNMLTHDAEQEKSFASKANRGQVFKDGVSIDVNRARALTNQIKMTWVLESVQSVLDGYFTSADRILLDSQSQILRKLMFKSVPFLTQQRLDELKRETRRLALHTKVCKATAATPNTTLAVKLKSTLALLAGNRRLSTDEMMQVEKVVGECQQEFDTTIMWKGIDRKINIGILDAPESQDLCDVLRVSRPSVGQHQEVQHMPESV